MKTALVVLPTYNERENITKLIPEIFNITEAIEGWKVSILVVDDSSPDKTDEVVASLQKIYPQLHLISGDKKGLGNAYRRGFAYGLEKLSPDTFIEMDSDMQHDPTLIPTFLTAIDQGADYVIGSRYIKGGSIPKNWSIERKFLSYVGNSLVLRLGFMKFKIHDWTTGYKAISANFIKQTLASYKSYDGYTFQIATLDRAIKDGLNIVEVPLVFRNRVAGSSKIDTLDFIFRNLMYILMNSPFVRYVIVGFLTAGIDFGVSYIFIEQLFFSVRVSTLLSATLAVITNFLLNNFWSFSFKKVENTASSFIKAFSKFVLASIGSVSLQIIMLGFLTDHFGVRFWFLYKALILGFVIIPYSYTVYNLFIWKTKK